MRERLNQRTHHEPKEHTMSSNQSTSPVAPPNKHQLALMIWIAVFPTLTAINLVFGSRLAGLPSVVRTFVLATVAVPIVIYGLMPQLHRLRKHLVTRTASL
jgi:antibiotic biosynthesis monooxygenase (ABM) superfamily enzyme